MSARGIFDLRIWIEGADEQEVYELAHEIRRRAAKVAPPGVDVRYTQLRNPRWTPGFHATMGRRRKDAG